MKTKTLLLVGLCAIGICTWKAQAKSIEKSPYCITIGDINMPNEYTGEDEGTNSDWWRPTNLGGTCDGLLVGSLGGPEVEAQLLNNTLGSPTCLFGGRLYYTDHAYSNKYGDETYVYDPNFPFPHYYYKIYYSTTPNQNNECISDAALIVYRNNILDYWHNGEFDTELPSNHTLIGFYIDHMYRNYAYMWHVIAHHAHANCTDTPPIID